MFTRRTDMVYLGLKQMSRGCFLRSYRFRSSYAVALSAATRLVTPTLAQKNPFSLVSDEMNTLAMNIMTLIGSGHSTLNKVTSYYFEAEGKKIRPLLVLLLSRALSEIPIEERNNIKVDTLDFCDDTKLSHPSSTLFDLPLNNISPLHILHGMKPLNPLTKMVNPFAETKFDKERGILPKQRRLAEIVEMIHTASLLHDDVIDHSGTRRGRPSGNAAFTNKMAVLAGDFLLGRATVSISRLRNPEVVELMSNSIANLVEGEFMQLKNTVIDRDVTIVSDGTKKTIDIPDGKLKLEPHQYSVSLPDTNNNELAHQQKVDIAFQYYLHKTYLKTAALMSKALRSTAILSGAKPPIIEECYNFGKNIGICFQLVDDLLDFSLSKKEIGKPVGVDLDLGIATAPVLYAWREDESLGPIIERSFSEPGDVEITTKAIHKYGGLSKTEKLAEQFKDKALANLREALPESDSRSALEFLTNSILTRRK
ncbi:trans-hexaprenyltranstransferase NDAI_0A06570 [Naumovozyma dairenensis CBS 421]|uniref:Hexaprenyl pyrophosphate synthase, mitochondrial n=1 Tax=Naumovozyma dairenensis (strain ATCC 10597 / BCRC 20456 / CBS 421 / NBRC 0211 / NRRL Y-12639) TaxID=1071378 RepID=G0W4S3_NAUDC|nr:hypothetical protein NDAI_0A06570 [Naumovozyma dairenensis CBS 421]CCD22811.1 hypothetical protein NDAI_0A06570 [Naumovozyma dairenensis CBS 421]